MTNSKENELSLDKLKFMRGGFKDDPQCEDRMGQAKEYAKTVAKPS